MIFAFNSLGSQKLISGRHCASSKGYPCQVRRSSSSNVWYHWPSSTSKSSQPHRLVPPMLLHEVQGCPRGSSTKVLTRVAARMYGKLDELSKSRVVVICTLLYLSLVGLKWCHKMLFYFLGAVLEPQVLGTTHYLITFYVTNCTVMLVSHALYLLLHPA